MNKTCIKPVSEALRASEVLKYSVTAFENLYTVEQFIVFSIHHKSPPYPIHPPHTSMLPLYCSLTPSHHISFPYTPFALTSAPSPLHSPRHHTFNPLPFQVSLCSPLTLFPVFPVHALQLLSYPSLFPIHIYRSLHTSPRCTYTPSSFPSHPYVFPHTPLPLPP